MRHAVLVLLASLVAARASAGPTTLDIALVEDADGKITESAAMPDQYLSAVACAFYGSHHDQYDAIFVFSAIPLNVISNTQQGWPVKQYQKGIGRMPYNATAAFCSKTGRLSQAVKMGWIDALPDDPDATYSYGMPFYTLSGIELMGHEFGHHWMASATYKTEDGKKHCLLRAYEAAETLEGDCDGYSEQAFNQHWSYYFNSGGVMYGNKIEDLGGGQFRVYNDGLKYGRLDQYLMGLRLAEQVGPLFLVDRGDGWNLSPGKPVPKGTEEIWTGTKVEFTIADVIRSLGPREPLLDPCHWKGAVIVVHEKGKPPTQAQRLKLVKYMTRWEEWYAWATDGRGSFDLTLSGNGPGTEECPGTYLPPPDDPPPEAAAEEATPEQAPEPLPEREETDLPVVSPESPEPAPVDAWATEAAPDTSRESTAVELPDTCNPGYRRCAGDVVVRCDESGTSWTVVEDCPGQGKVCRNAICLSDAVPDQGGKAPGSGGCVAGPPAAAAAFLPLLLLASLRLTRRARG